MNHKMTLSPEAAGLVARIRVSTQVALQLTRFVRRVAALVVFGALAVLEPLVRFLMMTMAILGVFVTIVFGFVIAVDGFPKWTMLGMSAGCFLLMAEVPAAQLT